MQLIGDIDCIRTFGNVVSIVDIAGTRNMRRS
jgi:hypothetical protein